MREKNLPSILMLTALILGPALHADEPAFSKDVIDFGIVVSDIETSVAFYTDVVGFKPAGEFSVPAEITSGAGLTQAGVGLHVRKLTLGENETATTLKLMQVDGTQPKPLANEHIHTTLGMSYMTLYVADTRKAIAHAAKHGVKPLKQGPVALGESKIFLTLLRDPDGNFVELVGP